MINIGFGKYFEEFEIGQEFSSPRRTVSESLISQFAGISGDFNPLHTDDEYAKDTRFNERIAHGLLGLTIGSGFLNSIWNQTAIAFLGLKWDFTGPLKIGDSISLKAKVVDKKESSKGDKGIVIVEANIVNQRNEVVQIGEWKMLILKKI